MRKMIKVLSCAFTRLKLSWMKITQDVREYTREKTVEEEKALAVGMAEKAKEFVPTGSEICHGNLPEGAKKYE